MHLGDRYKPDYDSMFSIKKFEIAALSLSYLSFNNWFMI